MSLGKKRKRDGKGREREEKGEVREGKGTDLWEEFNRSGECWSTSDEDSPACLLEQGPHELGSLGAVGLQGMALITYDHPKAVMYKRYAQFHMLYQV